MATTNEILAEIAEYATANGRPCPAKHLADKFGTGVLDQIATLKSEGKIYGRRGRNGGLTPAESLPDVAPAPDASESNASSDLAAEFAALAAKLAEESQVADPVAANG